jgi:nucleoside phosphorylase
METIGLIAAMHSESNALLQLIKRWKRFSVGPFRGVRFILLDREYHLVTTGMGLKRSIEATRSLIAKSRPSLLISFGIAGAVNNDLHIGDVVNAN